MNDSTSASEEEDLYVPAPLYEVVCVSATVHTPARREVPREVPGGRTGSDNCELGSETGLTGVW